MRGRSSLDMKGLKFTVWAVLYIYMMIMYNGSCGTKVLIEYEEGFGFNT